MAAKALPSIYDLRQCIAYDAETGLLTWIKKPSKRAGVSVGREAFRYITHDGYKMGGFGGWVGSAHRVAWAVHHGEWSRKILDHINGIKSDNRIINLREATAAQNSMNRKAQPGKSSHFKGVHCRVNGNGAAVWLAAIRVKSRNLHIGTFQCPTAAAIAYDVAAKQHFGDFAKLNFHQKIL